MAKMPTREGGFTKTLILPGLYGQDKLWKRYIAETAQVADEVIQLGNIIGCNDAAKDRHEEYGHNYSLIQGVAMYRYTQPRWLQIIGPNEVAALNSPKEWLNKKSQQKLLSDWAKGHMVVAGVSKGRLVTHGGLTHGEWLSIGSPQTAQEAADRLNEKYKNKLYFGPALNMGDAPNHWANPVWAHPAIETYQSWIVSQDTMPFGQIHHGSISDEVSLELRSRDYDPLNYVDAISYTNYGSIAVINGNQMLGIEMPQLKGAILTQMPQGYSFYLEKTRKSQPAKN